MLRPVALGTDCSGMETPVMALRNLGVPIDHVFSCDVNRHAKATIMANAPPRIFYDDLMVRDNEAAPACDLYIAGFPCQPFSSAGMMQGFDDKHGRGIVFFKIREYIAAQQPKVFMLENVAGLIRNNGGHYFRAILESLEDLGTYNIHAQILNTEDHGIPQSRRRVYIIGIKKSCDRKTFAFPEPLRKASIEDILEPQARVPTKDDLPPQRSGTAYRNVRTILKQLQAEGRDPFREPWIFDIDSSPDRVHPRLGVSPCVLRSRGNGFWVTNRGRRLTKLEMMRLQGITTPEEGFKVVVPKTELGFQIGNAMSVNVLERLLARLLPAAGLAPERLLQDRWAMAAALQELRAPRAAARAAAEPGKRGLKRRCAEASAAEAASSRGRSAELRADVRPSSGPAAERGGRRGGACALEPFPAKKAAGKAMSKHDVARAISEATDIQKSQVVQALNALASVAALEVKKNGSFKLPGLIQIERSVKPARRAATRAAPAKTVRMKARSKKIVVRAFCAAALRKATTCGPRGRPPRVA